MGRSRAIDDDALRGLSRITRSASKTVVSSDDAHTPRGTSDEMTLADVDEVEVAARAALPLVLAVNCLSDCELERRALAGVARFESVALPRHTRQSFNALIEEAAVLVLLSLHDLPPSLQHQAFMPSLVVVLSSDEEDRETAAAQQLGVQRLLRVHIDSTDAFADTAVTLALDLLRRTHEMAALPARHGTWTPTVDALRGMRRARGLTLGLVGIGPIASGVARRASAFVKSPFSDACS